MFFMGQYYKPILTVSKNKESETLVFYSPNFDEGLKLMEHAYVGNDLVTAVKIAISHYNSKGYTTKLTWAGDYADDIEGTSNNLYQINKPNVVGKADPEGNLTHFLFKENTFSMEMNIPRYLVNLDFLEYIDYEHVGQSNDKELITDPLPILTADGNGKGRGDYKGDGMKFVGTWKGCRVQFTENQPVWMEELKCYFKKGWGDEE